MMTNIMRPKLKTLLITVAMMFAFVALSQAQETPIPKN